MPLDLILPEPAGREDKPPAHLVPQNIIAEIEKRINAHITDITVVFGGYSPSANYKLDADNGKSYFIKGSHPGEMSHATETIRQEALTYNNINLLKNIAPHFYGTVWDGDEDGWLLGIWDFVAPADALDVEAIMEALVRMHMSSDNAQTLPQAEDKNYIQFFFNDDKKWRRLKDEPKTRDKFLSMFRDADQARQWFDAHIDALCRLQSRINDIGGARGLMHGDLRLDNILQDKDGKTYIVDWPNACCGPLIFDLVFLAAHLSASGIMTMNDAFTLYETMGGHRFTSDDKKIMIAVVAGFFADQAYRAVPPRLPRLRWMQKTMLYALLTGLAAEDLRMQGDSTGFAAIPVFSL